MKRKKLVLGVVIVAVVLIGILGYNFYSGKESFLVNTILIKQNIPFGGESVSNIRITNLEKTPQDFKIEFLNVENIASVDESEFEIGARELKEIRINFKDHLEKGIYVGQMRVSSMNHVEEIPIILTIEPQNRIFAVTQTLLPQYGVVSPGGKLGVALKIFNLDSRDTENVDVSYSILDLSGEKLFIDEENIILQGTLDMVKTIDLPDSLPFGKYVFTTSVKNAETQSDVGLVFTVSGKTEQIVDGSLKYFVILVVIFVVGIVAMFIYFIRVRDDLLLRLKRQQSQELGGYRRAVRERRRVSLGKVKTKAEKKKIIREFKEIKKKGVRKIKGKHKRQKVIIKKLKKRGKKSEMKSKIAEWKGQGFDVGEVFGNKKFSKKDVQGFKKQGYGV